MEVVAQQQPGLPGAPLAAPDVGVALDEPPARCRASAPWRGRRSYRSARQACCRPACRARWRPRRRCCPRRPRSSRSRGASAPPRSAPRRPDRSAARAAPPAPEHAREQLLARRRQRPGPDLHVVLGGQAVERAARQPASDEDPHRSGSMPRLCGAPRPAGLRASRGVARSICLLGAALALLAGAAPAFAQSGGTPLARPRRPLSGELSRRRRRPRADRTLDGARRGPARRAAGAAGDGRAGRVGPAQPAHARQPVRGLLQHAQVARQGRLSRLQEATPSCSWTGSSTPR